MVVGEVGVEAGVGGEEVIACLEGEVGVFF